MKSRYAKLAIGKLLTVNWKVYITTLAGNLLLIVAVRTSNHLHTSMYFFLANLSFLDLGCTSSIVPKMLSNFLLTKKTISYTGCITQVYFFLLMAETECILLAMMAYDRYVAICHPLHYNIIMNKAACFRLISVSWLTGGIISSIDIYFLLHLKFCGPNIINHFFCEGPSLLQLSCSDITLSNIIQLVGTIFFFFIPIPLILFSYFRIIMAILKIPMGKYKAFSTCVSHLMVVVMFYGAAIFMYMRPDRSTTENTDKMVAVFYTVITPILNPMIYSLRNKDVHRAMRQLHAFSSTHVCGLRLSHR
ncbi:olfactory receptor 2D3-like [Hyperolius riggenbachi]|uniref:olfactory receptor 2D3-like n=1 Tax=Hyperolius riggenbachi TaxID=752182 RepID=UPI0035A2D11E